MTDERWVGYLIREDLQQVAARDLAELGVGPRDVGDVLWVELRQPAAAVLSRRSQELGARLVVERGKRPQHILDGLQKQTASPF